MLIGACTALAARPSAAARDRLLEDLRARHGAPPS